MKETGLMFKAPLVRAILSGQKTQTRRMVNPQPHEDRMHQSVDPPTRGSAGEWTWWAGNHTQGIYHSAKCPFGKPGDRIYVRETFARVPTVCGSDELVFAADYQDGSDKAAGVKYTPAIHMPKAAARIWLEVTGLRVERLQSISRGDATAEGCPFPNMADGADPRKWFAELWDSTTVRPSLPENENSRRYARVKHWLDTNPDTTSWAANPWVWVIDFKPITNSKL